MDLGQRPVVMWIHLVVLAQLSVRALVGGLALMVAPSGSLVGASTAPLDGLPVTTFTVPGLVLATVFGLTPALAIYGLYSARRWGWLTGVAVGVALLGWVLLEAVIGFVRPTVWLNLATAVAIIGLSLHPSVRDLDVDGTV